ncbi:DUF554 domain-containing protein [uncultured Phascolarctobacterium sp.]|uniref:DUF554 domain-containing protein n=1 Tax=uncultured Phascolarctobacterium sp. TaxID=512296 RepID=UPI0026055F37|nr:DUF554 domain-containing protein [uncultured Phascolarctobacterium sp.]
MLGTIVNTGCILAGSVIGSFVSCGISEKYKTALFNGLGLATVGLGANAFVSNMPKVAYPVLFIASIAIGTVIGTWLDLDGHFRALLEKAKGGSKLAEGLSTAILLFCIGTLSILGPIESRLNGNNTYLFTNATLDFVSSIILSSAYGIGITAAALVLFLWQGSIYLFAGIIAPYMTPALMGEISVLGGIFLMSSGLGILEVRDCKTLNMLPALLVPPLFYALINVVRPFLLFL